MSRSVAHLVFASAAATGGSVDPYGLALLPAFLPTDATTPAGRRRVAWRRVARLGMARHGVPTKRKDAG